LPPNEKREAVVITIPASFDSMQSNATINAGAGALSNEMNGSSSTNISKDFKGTGIG
jgi:hypothetical protein